MGSEGTLWVVKVHCRHTERSMHDNICTQDKISSEFFPNLHDMPPGEPGVPSPCCSPLPLDLLPFVLFPLTEVTSRIASNLLGLKKEKSRSF